MCIYPNEDKYILSHRTSISYHIGEVYPLVLRMLGRKYTTNYFSVADMVYSVRYHSLSEKDTFASFNLFAQITPRPSMSPRHELHSRQYVEHTGIPLCQ